MTTVVEERRRRGHGRGLEPVERADWDCENCQARVAWPRKRCAECGTSRY